MVKVYIELNTIKLILIARNIDRSLGQTKISLAHWILIIKLTFNPINRRIYTLAT